ncbi:putative hydrolase [Bimuria novae-zelandiae CBS 107.79]|uniref:Putative hydrolase n=1 Tax=Bimuria novae-zelandiae CBS 107.79 TaxID=1447943 RepID=A0A6A5UVG7_9PLEO|nr:putative hydrolase [Bimuria novae-zelandiae CBS 107.79]
MVTECCLSGFRWPGTPTGREGKIVKNDTYITGNHEKVAILVVADLFGYTFTNTRLLSDFYAASTPATVYVPDFFGGEVFDPAIVRNPGRWNEIDLEAWSKRNAKGVRWEELKAVAKELKGTYERSLFRLGAAGEGLCDCISTAHPTWFTKAEIDDVAFTPELKTYANEVIPTKGMPYDYQYFPGVEHSFATRGNLEDERERRAAERTKRAQVGWMREWLRGADGQ